MPTTPSTTSRSGSLGNLTAIACVPNLSKPCLVSPRSTQQPSSGLNCIFLLLFHKRFKPPVIREMQIKPTVEEPFPSMGFAKAGKDNRQC